MIGISFLLAMGLAAGASNTAGLILHQCDFGEVYAFANVECRIGLENPGDQSVGVDLSGSNPEDVIKPVTLTVPAHRTAEATIRIAAGNTAGTITRLIKIHHHDGAARDEYVRAIGFVMSALDDPTAAIVFGSVDRRVDRPGKTLELGSHDAADFRILRILEAPDALDVRIGSDRRTISAHLRPDGPWGLLDGDIKLAIDTPHQHEAWIHVSGDIRGEIVPEKNPYWFGGIPSGSGRTVLVPLTDRHGRDFRIGRVELERMDAAVDIVPCVPAAISCKAIRLKVSDSQRPGITRGVLDVQFPDLDRHLNLRIWGILQPPESTHSQGQSVDEPANESAPWASSIIESINAPVYAVPVDDPEEAHAGPPPATAPLPGVGPLLKWSAVDEKGAHGYQIFRSDAEAGPFVLLDPKTIPVHPKLYAEYPYQWRDTTAEIGHSYWYYIGVVYKDGRKQALSKPQEKIVRETPASKG